MAEAQHQRRRLRIVRAGEADEDQADRPRGWRRRHPAAVHPSRAHIHARLTLGERAADALGTCFFTWPCFWLHVVWFAGWIVLRLDINQLTMIVSLEAIFLCVLLGMSQNRQAEKDRRRDDTEAGEVELSTAILQRLDMLTADLHSHTVCAGHTTIESEPGTGMDGQ